MTGGSRGLGLEIARAFARRAPTWSSPAASSTPARRWPRSRAAERPGRAALRLPRRPVGRARRLADAAYERVRPRRRPGQQRRHVAGVRRRSREVSEELFDKMIARQPQGPVPAGRAGRRADGRRRRRLDHQRVEHRRGPADGRHRALRRGQGRRQRDDRRPRRRVRAEGPRQRDHARPVPHRRSRRLGHGRLRANAQAAFPLAPRRRAPRRSSAPRCTSPATRRATRPAPILTVDGGARWAMPGGGDAP